MTTPRGLTTRDGISGDLSLECGVVVVGSGAGVARAISRYLAAGGPAESLAGPAGDAAGPADRTAGEVGAAAGAGGYGYAVASRDFHIDPGEHFSAAPDYAATWPPHCVAGTPGADFHPDLDTSRVEAIFSKGAHEAAYSAFEGIDETGAGLADWLRRRGVTALDVAGIATDYCVRATAVDAARQGFATRVLLGLTAGVDPTTTREALAAMRASGVEIAGALPRR